MDILCCFRKIIRGQFGGGKCRGWRRAKTVQIQAGGGADRQAGVGRQGVDARGEGAAVRDGIDGDQREGDMIAEIKKKTFSSTSIKVVFCEH